MVEVIIGQIFMVLGGMVWGAVIAERFITWRIKKGKVPTFLKELGFIKKEE